MPIFRAGEKLVFYAHVPKCGGSAVSWYLGERFGRIAFNDDRFMSLPPARRWSRTSPQHIDRESLSRLFPDGFFDAVFTIVRHPVSRLVSAYHFQAEVERSIPGGVGFSEWLIDLEDRLAEDPFAHDNHVRPMHEIVPDGAKVFHLEHGVDALVPWFDALTGTRDAPRAVPRINEQKRNTRQRGEKAPPVAPSDSDLGLIARLYAQDFARFGYTPEERAPAAPAPEIPPEQVAERAALQRRLDAPLNRLKRRLTRRGVR